MKIIDNLQNFLQDQDYYIDIFNNTLHVYYYENLIALTPTLIELKLKEFILIVEGNNLVVSNMDKHEILVKGRIDKLEFKR